ncbi:hypothetical protein SShM2_135 [Synechococcus phage S-ShM2]|jgi:hypothetical protein|uniref:Uncharacterized protein n=3 Tax=Ahtivirus sagseatwo TaxID=2734079 RepID=A0A1D7SKH6_9CAUD|nr:hypothetical protein SShM2_135 [Synechococcus phage S-ShM2]AGH57424.1 hypothetical protein CPLG_00170 [Cyanophage S-SSM2]AOO13239.1 hypothetical protein LIS021110_125 [Cyanophage S-RIM14]ADO97746.1 hypothetical protein SShM2_135 [Synechococcus phage S-ShM2]AOO13455.1 hypothetical protein LIS110610_125 [Cyanophage S-RIM14]AOO13671.1 hypothetical protein Np111211_125 [Cyanophage S-RIM14]
MWILIAPESGGVYAAKDLTNTKVVQIFEEEDDAVRYHGLLQAEDFKDILTVEEVDLTTVVANCRKYGYSYTIINKDELVIPPL